MTEEQITQKPATKIKPKEYCIIPLRDMVIFPRITTTILVGRPKSLAAVKEAENKNEMIFAVSQKRPSDEKATKKNINKVGTLCRIVHSMETPDGTMKIVLDGISKAEIKEFSEDDSKCLKASVNRLSDVVEEGDEKEVKELGKIAMNKFAELIRSSKNMDEAIIGALLNVKSNIDLAYYISSFLDFSTEKKQEILAECNIKKRILKTLNNLELELNMLRTEKEIAESVTKKFAKTQRKVFLKEQLKEIKKELGEDLDEEDDDTDVAEIRGKLKKLKLTSEAKEKCNKELAKLSRMHSISPEYNVTVNYLDWITSLPWNKKTKIKKSVADAEKILNRDHYGLDKVKERILEFLAVYKRTNSLRGPIICLVGPPGVGKTSLAKSIAEAVNRKYIKVSLGGVRDEAEIRGHRRTYVGSMPGKIIQSMKKAAVSNPLMLLDEIDKMNSDLRGDPTSAMLEVLDPEQNINFNDHYLEVDYDLSDVMFIATANSLGTIPGPLRDRMEVIKLSGYTEDEKLNISKKYLIKKQLKQHGLKASEFSINDAAIKDIIREYTFEAGVRNLEREIAKLVRKATREIVTGDAKKVSVTRANLEKYLGVRKFSYGKVGEKDLLGTTTGLAYTEFGGDLLSIEALKFEGSGNLKITGKLGEVMQESVQAAFSHARSMATLTHKIDAETFNKWDFHVHVPEGATPKDGPSAGIAIYTSLTSIILNRPVKKDVAMTGEITLNGKVLPIGGLKEKLLAALRGGIKTVIIPKDNEKNLKELPKNILEGLKIHPVSTVEEVIELALRKK